jgi:hypothetical protein
MGLYNGDSVFCEVRIYLGELQALRGKGRDYLGYSFCVRSAVFKEKKKSDQRPKRKRIQDHALASIMLDYFKPEARENEGHCLAMSHERNADFQHCKA